MKVDKRLLPRALLARLDLVLTVGLGLSIGVVMIGQAWLLSQAVSQVFLGDSTLLEVRGLLAGLLILSLVRFGLVWASDLTSGRLARTLKHDLRMRLTSHLLDLGPAYVRGERSGELTNTVVEGIEALDAYYRQYLPQLAISALVPLVVLFFVFPLDWISGLVLLLTAPLIPIFMILIGNTADGLTKRQWDTLSRMSAHFLDMLQGLTTLKLFGRSREQIKTIAQISDRYRQTTMGVLRVSFLSALVLEMVATLSTAVVAVQIGLRLLTGQMAFQEGLFVLLLAPEFYLPLRMLGARFHAGMDGVAAAHRIFEVLDTPPALPEPATHGVGTADLSTPLSFSFSDVHYAYDGGQRPALRGTSFHVSAGQRVALVGPSGAGKSTVAYLLLRFIEPDGGSITVDGRHLSDLPPVPWRAQVAWVPQNPHLFHGSVAENIRLARPDATLDELMWAARQAHAGSFIAALPQGYETIIGERGARLSGGEAQRIALARAYLKDAPLVILDEATANLDPETEDLIRESMDRLLKGRTALLIAHRLSTVHGCHRVFVMDGGRVVEEGTHSALLERDGLYTRLVGAYGGAGAA
jgi:ATP-binding cassette subfamily C protein CydD